MNLEEEKPYLAQTETKIHLTLTLPKFFPNPFVKNIPISLHELPDSAQHLAWEPPEPAVRYRDGMIHSEEDVSIQGRQNILVVEQELVDTLLLHVLDTGVPVHLDPQGPVPQPGPSTKSPHTWQ